MALVRDKTGQSLMPTAPTGIVSGGQPKFKSSYSIKRGPGITESLTPITPTKPEKPFKQKLKEDVAITVEKEKAKIELESSAAKKSAIQKLVQSKRIFKKMNNRTKEILGGVDLPAEFGVRGAANWITGKVIKNNQYVKTYEGDLYSTATFLMRAIMPGRAEKMVEGFKGTLPDIFSTDVEADEQLVQSVLTTVGDYVSKNSQEFPELKTMGYDAFLDMKEQEMREMIEGAGKQVGKPMTKKKATKQGADPLGLGL